MQLIHASFEIGLCMSVLRCWPNIRDYNTAKSNLQECVCG